jgi:hypothetical protein
MSPLGAMSASRPLLILVRDLLLASRVTTAARAKSVEHKLLRDPGMLIEETGDRLIVDLNQLGALDAAVNWKRAAPAREVIGFVSHVDADTIRRARELGIDQVVPRSRFVEILPELLDPR